MLTATDLLEPLGSLTPGMFPGDDAETTLDAYLETAYERADTLQVAATDRDEYARALVYARAWERVATRLSSTPANVSLADQGTRTYNAEQLRQAVANADRWRAVATDLEPITEAPIAPPSPGTQFLRTNFSF